MSVDKRCIHKWIYVSADTRTQSNFDRDHTQRAKVMTEKNLPDELIPLRPVVFEILLILNQSPLHGYGIMKEVADRTGGRTIMGPGTLYRTLKEMQQQGLVIPTRRPAETRTDDERRRYYRITKHGQRVAAAEAARMAALVGVARAGNLLTDRGQA